MILVFNATFNNISIILWWSVLLMEETRVPGENHWTVTSQMIAQVVVNPTAIRSWPRRPQLYIVRSTWYYNLNAIKKHFLSLSVCCRLTVFSSYSHFLPQWNWLPPHFLPQWNWLPRNNWNTFNPVLRGHLWDKEKVVF